MMFKMVCLCLLLFLGVFLNLGESVTKTWKFTNDILNPINWEGGKPSKDCKGIIFPEVLGSIGSVFELYTEEVVLPINGELEIRQGGYIQFSKNYPCLKIKRLKHYFWLSPESWNYEKNAAIPDVEKVPCVYDDVVFPSEGTVAVFYPENPISVNSLQIGGVGLSNDQWQSFLDTDYGIEQFAYSMEYKTEINIEPKKCTNKGGCTCHVPDDYNDIWYWICEKKEKREKVLCLHPVKPVGHCNYICGGIVTLHVDTNFVFADLEKRIPKHEKVDAYASKVEEVGKFVIQVIFVEKEEYSQLSTEVANDFHSTISKDLKGFRVNSATLEVSGIRLPEGSQWSTAFSIIFGTLAAVSLIFAFIYAVYIGPLEEYNLSSRIPFREMSLGNLRPFLFAKFENKDEGQMSMAGSVMSLEKAFDNPMYGSHRASTSSAAMDIVVLTETQPSTSETTHENPAYREMRCEKVEIEDIIEDTEK